MVAMRRLPLLCLMLMALVLSTGGCQIPNNVLRQRGLDALDRGDTATAEENFALAVGQDPADWKASWYLGRIFLDTGRLLDAELLLERAYSIRRDNVETGDILDDLAESLYQQGSTQELLDVLHQRAEETRSTRAYMRQGRYLWLTHDADAALVAFRKAAQFAKPDDPTPYLAQADFYESIGDRERTIKALRHAYAIIPESQLLIERLRGYGYVPGPALALPPEKEVKVSAD